MGNEKKCTAQVEVYSRVVGFFRPVQQWNRGKREEFRERKTFKVDRLKNEESNNESP